LINFISYVDTKIKGISYYSCRNPFNSFASRIYRKFREFA